MIDRVRQVLGLMPPGFSGISGQGSGRVSGDERRLVVLFDRVRGAAPGWMMEEGEFPIPSKIVVPRVFSCGRVLVMFEAFRVLRQVTLENGTAFPAKPVGR